MAELLLELYSSEIPARMQKPAEDGFEKLFTEIFQKNKIKFSNIYVESCSTRIVIYCKDIPIFVESEIVHIKGPKASVSEDILNKFCSAHGVEKSDLEVKDMCYTYSKVIPERKTSDVLVEILPEILSSYTWQKSMYWGDHKFAWVRPLLNILCLFNDEVLDFQYYHLKANNFTYGHQFMHPERIEVKNYYDYSEKLESAKVIFSRFKREQMIKRGIDAISDKNHVGYDIDPNLFDEIKGLIEYPNVLLGEIPEKFLSLPKEILITSMRNHQRYIPTLNSEVTTKKDLNGILANKFIFVANITTNNDAYIVEGNERVLNARLSDAMYFYNQDLKRTLESRVKDLDKMVFHSEIGTMKEKVERLVKIADYLYKNDKIFIDLAEIHKGLEEDTKKAALLSKSDLLTEVVGEFPELQGIMGGYYAKLVDKTTERVAGAIREHYMPRGADDKVPKTLLGGILSIIDKIDSLVCMFVAGERPTGSKDPYALRRIVLGVMKTISEYRLSVDVINLVHKNIRLVAEEKKVSHKSKNDLAQIEKDIILFMEDRIKHFFSSQDYAHELIRAVVDLGRIRHMNAIFFKLQSARDFLDKEEGVVVLGAYKRMQNIMPKNFVISEVNESLFGDYEKNLYKSLNEINLEKFSDYEYAEKSLYKISKTVNAFLDNVFIDDGDNVKKQNRLSLLKETMNIFNEYVNFALLCGNG